ncbi:hypothetical protein BKA65DRAFT_533432 [Rhexocercosporidium sp. MPI-PUGE-AT-0058]|nr:hypothetical protein BKA65DRAFT_533432 [Rhexocercosporidium sp. MPI-PUGE-AT-0058]
MSGNTTNPFSLTKLKRGDNAFDSGIAHTLLIGQLTRQLAICCYHELDVTKTIEKRKDVMETAQRLLKEWKTASTPRRRKIREHRGSIPATRGKVIPEVQGILAQIQGRIEYETNRLHLENIKLAENKELRDAASNSLGAKQMTTRLEEFLEGRLNQLALLTDDTLVGSLREDIRALEAENNLGHWKLIWPPKRLNLKVQELKIAKAKLQEVRVDYRVLQGHFDNASEDLESSQGSVAELEAQVEELFASNASKVREIKYLEEEKEELEGLLESAIPAKDTTQNLGDQHLATIEVAEDAKDKAIGESEKLRRIQDNWTKTYNDDKGSWELERGEMENKIETLTPTEAQIEGEKTTLKKT